MMDEIFVDITGFEKLYEIGNFGSVFGKEKMIQNNHNSFWIKKRTKRRLTRDKDGYLLVSLWKEGKEKKYRVHRLVAENFIENPENKPEVNHKDKNVTNNHFKNLEWVTSKENCKHKLESL